MVSNDDEDLPGCVCDIENNYLTKQPFDSDAPCYCCDTENPLVVGAINNQCVGKDNTVFNEDTCGFDCVEKYVQVEVNGVDECIRCDAETGAFINEDDGVCECPELFMLFNGECVACSGLNARLNILGECDCGNDEILNDDGVCECDASIETEYKLWPLFIAIPEGDNKGCVKCYGLGAQLNDNGVCTCEGVVDAQFDAFEIGKCACKRNIFTVSIVFLINFRLFL